LAGYRVTVNVEWTSACNARCLMCPREAIPQAEKMDQVTFRQILEYLNPDDVFRAVVAGYGEPTTHPRFGAFIRLLSEASVPVDMVSNGERLNERRLKLLDGRLRTLIISFSSVDAGVYGQVHAGLRQDKVMANIQAAAKNLRRTELAISLSPLAQCIATLPETIGWLRARGVKLLTMSPSLYDRAGTLGLSDADAHRLRDIIVKYRLHSQELDFIPGIPDIAGQWMANRFKCLPRNTSLFISADGHYQYCFNDISRRHPLAHVSGMNIRQVLDLRERTECDARICGDCNMRSRYRLPEVMRAAWWHFKKQ